MFKLIIIGSFALVGVATAAQAGPACQKNDFTCMDYAREQARMDEYLRHLREIDARAGIEQHAASPTAASADNVLLDNGN